MYPQELPLKIQGTTSRAIKIADIEFWSEVSRKNPRYDRIWPWWWLFGNPSSFWFHNTLSLRYFDRNLPNDDAPLIPLIDETFQLMIMTEFGLEKRRRLRDRYVSNSIEREQMIFEQILRTILDEDLTRYDVADWIWVISYSSYHMSHIIWVISYESFDRYLSFDHSFWPFASFWFKEIFYKKKFQA